MVKGVANISAGFNGPSALFGDNAVTGFISRFRKTYLLMKRYG